MTTLPITSAFVSAPLDPDPDSMVGKERCGPPEPGRATTHDALVMLAGLLGRQAAREAARSGAAKTTTIP
jgi:hypothetical protein